MAKYYRINIYRILPYKFITYQYSLILILYIVLFIFFFEILRRRALLFSLFIKLHSNNTVTFKTIFRLLVCIREGEKGRGEREIFAIIQRNERI
jgi:hypothetical protein